ncbi:hypothetical protein FIBSPDRAFT_1025387 [Athelia psychrophila]|uniref:Uncharacterized protein n=1 Tax=Athelia psychrophila TaxID=1759441 RepID=A0A166HUF0_9AGAM|nr:hypothetical protein FIBSPDRAFT_1025387 [Fibularhizoctonia sp. CBS 109695]
MDEYPMLLLSRPTLDAVADNRDDTFNPHDLIDEHLETYIHASSDTYLNEQSVRTSPASTASKGRGFAVGILEQHCAIPFAVRLLALLIGFGTFFLALSIVLWLSHRQYHDLASFIPTDVSGILVREPASQGDSNSNETVAVGLIISSVATQFVALTAPFLLGTVAYRLGFDWCKASQELAYEQLPTQAQYGLMIDMFTIANIATIWRAGSYLFQRTVRRTKAPQVLLRGFSILLIFFALTRFIGLADLALHSTTSSIILPAVNNMETATTAYGTTVNSSAVAQGSSEIIQYEGVLTAGNQSLINQVFTLNNESRMAYIARLSADMPADGSFIAPTLGVESTCIPITAACLSRTLSDPNSGFGEYNCSSGGYPDYHQSNKSFGIPSIFSVPSKYVSNANGTNGIFSLNRNPFPAIYINQIIGTTCAGCEYFAADIYYIFLACNISVYDTVLQYSQGTYTMLNRTLSTPENASVVTQPISVYADYSILSIGDMYVPLVVTLADDIKYSTATNGQEQGNFIAADLSRLLLSYSAGYLSTNPAYAIANLGVITRYNTTSLVITLSLVSLYSLLAFCIFGLASIARIEPASHLMLACEKQSHVVSTHGLVYNTQLRLTRPSTLVPHALYGCTAECQEHGIPPCPAGPAGYAVSKEVEPLEGLDGRNCDRLAIIWELGVKGSSDVTTRVRAVGDDQDEEGTPASQSAVRYHDAASPMSGAGSSSPTSPGAENLRTPSGTSAADTLEVSNSPRKYRMPLSGRLPALMIFLGSGVLATSIICWLYIRRYRALDGGQTPPFYPYITVKEPSRSSDIDADGTVLVGLLISSITTQFVTLTAPLLLVVVAYQAAIDWLEYSGRMNLPNLPTPHQYGHLMNLFSVGGLGVLLEIGGYLRDHKNRVKAPRMLIGAFLTAAIIFVITHIVGLADLALHSTTTTGTLSSVNVVDPSGSVYGTVPFPFDSSPFNHTLRYGPFGPAATRLEGILTADERSAMNSVLILDSDDPMAYITRVNGLIPTGVSFTASSLGISAQCTSISKNCAYDIPMPPQGCWQSNCPAHCNGYPKLTKFVDEDFAVYSDQWSGSDVRNPFKALWQVNIPQVSKNYQFTDLLGNSTFLIVACNFTVYNIFLHYTNGSYTLVNKTITPGAAAAYATYPLYIDSWLDIEGSMTMNETFPIIPRLLGDLVGMNPPAADFAAKFSPVIARLVLALSAGVLQSTPATQVMKDGIVTRYPFIPLAIYLLFVYLYALLALGIFVWAASAAHPSAGPMSANKRARDYKQLASDFGSATGGESPGQTRELAKKAQWHISQPSSLVAALFGGGREEEEGSDIDACGEHMNEKKLAVGLHEQTEEDGSNQRLVYGVWEVQGFKEAKEE